MDAIEMKNEGRFAGLEGRIAGLDGKLEGFSKRLDQISSHLTVIFWVILTGVIALIIKLFSD
jgi:hypothetical protein